MVPGHFPDGRASTSTGQGTRRDDAVIFRGPQDLGEGVDCEEQGLEEKKEGQLHFNRKCLILERGLEVKTVE